MRIGLLLAAALLCAARPAGAACPPATLEEHQLDPAYASDTEAPSTTTVYGGVFRCVDEDRTARAGVDIQVTARDPQLYPEQLGYQVTVSRGTPPPGLELPSFPVVPEISGSSSLLHFYYDAAYRDGFDIDVEVRARDLNGNLGEPGRINLVESDERDVDHDSGCFSQGGNLAPTEAFLVGAFVMRPRRRRTPPSV
jgi:hypothetical protein